MQTTPKTIPTTLPMQGLDAPAVQRVPIRLPSGMAPAMRARVAARLALTGGKWRLTFSRGERAVLRRRAPMPVSKWAAKHRVLTESSIPGRWHNEITPYSKGIMDASFFSCVEKIIIEKSPQTGLSEAIHNCIGYAIDRAPAPVIYVYPDELTARDNAKDRIIPMLDSSPRLRSYLRGSTDTKSSLRVDLAHMTIHMAWAGSVSRLGNKPACYIVLDESNKYPKHKTETTPQKLAEARTTTYPRRRRIWEISTPTDVDGAISVAMRKEAQAVFDYHVVCPHCGREQLMVFDRIRWAKGERDAEKVQSQRLAWYQCENEHCGTVWSDGDRDRAVRMGQWRERSTGLELFAHLNTYKPAKIGFHVPSWLSYFVSLSEVAAAFLRWNAVKGTPEALELLKDFCNRWKAEPWVQHRQERKEDGILALADDRPRGVVPGPLPESPKVPRVAALVAGIDTQGATEDKAYYRYVIRAFGWGEEEESWLVQCGTVPTLKSLGEVLWRSVYRDSQGNEYRVRLAMQDAMGRLTKQVYAFCAANKGRILPTQGKRSQAAPIIYAPQEYYPGTTKRIPGGIRLAKLDTTFFKNDLSAKLAIAPEDPGAFHLHHGTPMEYAREMVAEYYDEGEQAWLCPKGVDNHFWDCEMLALAGAHALNISKWARPDEEAAQQKPPPQQARPAPPPAHHPAARPNWFGGGR